MKAHHDRPDARRRVRILIDLRCLETVTATRGVGRYTTELVRAMVPLLPPEWELLGLSWAGTGHELGIGDIRYPGPKRGISLADELILPRLTRTHRIDLYHSPVYPLFRPTKGGPCRIITVHDLIADIYPEAFTWRQRRVFRKMFRSATTADRVITDSETTRRDLLDRYPCDPDKVVAIPLGISECFLNCTASPDAAPYPRPYLLHVGGLDPTKNVPFLLEVLAELHRTGARCHLVLAGGDDPRRAPLVTRAHELGVADHLIFPGQLDDHQLAEAYRGATAFLFPSLYEGFGLPPLEAMACGCPVVASPAGSLREIVGEGAMLAGEGDRITLVEATTSLLASSSRRARLVARGLSHASSFPWRRASHQTLAIYQYALDPQGPGSLND